ncbi:MAG: dimethyl sulfoxide reductase anchor subunit family protein, partial [Anaerolineales bacterium]
MNVREWALPVYTILTQTATGTLFFLWLFRYWVLTKIERKEMEKIISIPLLIILIIAIFGMVGAHFHLSKPYLSFLAVSNFSHSWLSREIVFTVFFFLCLLTLFLLQQFSPLAHHKIEAFAILAILFGFITVYCMGRIYQLPTQVAWNSPWTIPYYFITTFLLGVSALPAILLMDIYFLDVTQPGTLHDQELLVRKAFQILALIAIAVTIFIVLLNVAQI